jgi:single-stranded DNA-binding protein
MIFRLKVYQGKDRKPLFISCACYSYVAARAKITIKDGSKVIVTGALSASEDKEGKQRIGLFCTDVNVLESTPKENPVPFQKNQDYEPVFTGDDVPF